MANLPTKEATLTQLIIDVIRIYVYNIHTYQGNWQVQGQLNDQSSNPRVTQHEHSSSRMTCKLQVSQYYYLEALAPQVFHITHHKSDCNFLITSHNKTQATLYWVPSRFDWPWRLNNLLFQGRCFHDMCTLDFFLKGNWKHHFLVHRNQMTIHLLHKPVIYIINN